MQTAREFLEQAHQAAARRAWGEAFELFQRALAVEPDYGDALQGGAVALRWLGRREEALAWLDQAIAVLSEPASAWNTRGNVLLDLARYPEALEAFDRAVERLPSFTLAQLGRGYAFIGLQRPADALESFDAAGRIDPDCFEAQQWGGKAAVQLGATTEALARFERARRIRPSADVELDIANACGRDGRLDEALAGVDRVLAAEPGNSRALYMRAVGHLSQGNYREGWRDYEHRVEGAHIREVEPELAARCLRWPTAQQLAGRTVLLVGGQGIGDIVMFASVIPDLLTIAGHVTLTCDARLHRLFANSFPGLRLLPRLFPKGEVDAHDVTVMLSSLCGVFRNELADFPGQPYLTPTPAAVARWRSDFPAGGDQRVGLSWRGGHASTGGVLRSLPATELAQALAAPHRELISLQYGDTAQDQAALHDARIAVRFPDPHKIDDFDDLAALVSTLDGVVSVQTSLVHLCGAIGAPCHVLLPKVPEWRYAAHPTRMPWYASVSLHRAGDDRADALRLIERQLGGPP